MKRVDTKSRWEWEPEKSQEEAKSYDLPHNLMSLEWWLEEKGQDYQRVADWLEGVWFLDDERRNTRKGKSMGKENSPERQSSMSVSSSCASSRLNPTLCDTQFPIFPYAVGDEMELKWSDGRCVLCRIMSYLFLYPKTV